MLRHTVVGVFCNRCGQRVVDPGALFCAGCGAALDRDATAELLPLPRRPMPDSSSRAAAPADPTLVVRRGPNLGSRFLLRQGRTRIGRHPDADVFLDDVTVSRHHAVIARVGERCTLEDVGSLNGTYLNGDRSDGPTPLRHGDEVQIGLFKLVFFGPRSDDVE